MEGKTENLMSRTEFDASSGTTQQSATPISVLAVTSSIKQKRGRLGEFDPNTLDFTQSSSWNRSGEAFQVTNGYAPLGVKGNVRVGSETGWRANSQFQRQKSSSPDPPFSLDVS